MPQFGMHAAKTHLSSLVERALAGEEIVLTRNGESVAKIVPYTRPRRVFGRYAHLLGPGPHDWSAVTEPMSEEELRELEEGHPGDPLRAMATDASGVPPG